MTLQDSNFSDNEIKRIHELLTESANSSVQNPQPYMIGNHNIVDFCGQVLAKREKYFNKKLSVDLFLQLPYQTTFPTYLSEKSDLIFDYCSRNVLQGFTNFTQEIITELIENNRLVSITLYGNNAESAESINSPNLVYFINVHLKKDNFYTGYYQYIMHEGRDNGKGCFIIDNDSVLGKITCLFDFYIY